MRWITKLRIYRLEQSLPIIEKRILLAEKRGDLDEAQLHAAKLYFTNQRITRLYRKLETWGR